MIEIGKIFITICLIPLVFILMLGFIIYMIHEALWKDSRCGCSDIRVNKANSFTKIGNKKGRVRINWT